MSHLAQELCEKSTRDDLSTQIEHLLRTDKTVNDAMYRPDIPIKIKTQRKEAGLLPHSII